MSKRILDLILALVGLAVFFPLLVLCSALIFFYDRSCPFYRGQRVGKDGHFFKIVKLRTMVKNAALLGGASTSNGDPRLLPVASWLRRFKLDEIPQLWNVLKGEMSLVGPRPNVWERGVCLYNEAEKSLLKVKPGITDLASIVFSDEGAILEKAGGDPDEAYERLIRPKKSALALAYIPHACVSWDLVIIVATLTAIFSKKRALSLVAWILKCWNAPAPLRQFVLGRRVENF